MSSTIVVGYDGEDAATRVLDRAIEEARAGGDELVVVSVAEMPFNPEGPQNFGTLDDTPARMIPLVEPEELEPVREQARAKVEAAGIAADYVWGAGGARQRHRRGRERSGARLVVLGAHHHGMLSRLLGTDVAAVVKRDAGCDVLVVD